DNLSAFFGEVVIYDNCPASNTIDERLLGELNTCGAGVLTREISLINAQGVEVDFCTQQITFQKGTTLQFSDITPPQSEVTVTGCGIDSIDPSILGMPIVPDQECQQSAISISNDTFPFTQNGACLKIIRTFKVIDWCIDDGPGSIFEPFEFVQTIKVNNTVGPEIENVFADTVFCSYEVGCGAININDYLTATASDDCTDNDELLNSFEVKDSEGKVVNFGNGLDASGTYDVDTYTVRFVSEDKCGNQTLEESTFEVRSCKLPTPYCLQGLSTTLIAMDTTGDGNADAEMVMLTPEFFDAGSYHPCGYSVQLSFSADVNDNLRTFFCSDTVGLQQIELWVTDSNGGQDYCTTFVDIQDNDDVDLCGGLKPADVAGRVYTEEDAELQDAEVELRGLETSYAMTDENGLYEFLDMPMGGSYKVAPIKDNDYLNGVSTLDLVLIQRHILGIAPLNSNYKMIAADINNNEKISASDLTALRKVILGIDTSFPNNTSWRFIDAGYEFVNAENPWENPIDESYTISSLSEDMQVDFIAVKTGDVNGNVDMNIAAGNVIETRSAKSLTLGLPSVEIESGKVYKVDVNATNDLHLFGLQKSFELEGLEILNIIPGTIDMKMEYTSNSEGMMHLSYASGIGEKINAGDKLYTLVVRGTENGQLESMISLSTKGLNTEAYLEENLEIGTIDLEWRNEEAEFASELMVLEGNHPNPWRSNTEIDFFIPQNGNVTLTVTDVSGRIVMNQSQVFNAGGNSYNVTNEDIQMKGLLLYKLTYDGQVVTGKMIKIE
ncbi:MAG: T9SS type A sorting domain-containing protein, partial [Saprospiraceae bacterium]|nr:T9SS type A sorting domain-containing protein [Saprospiraceae bacterium]